MGAKVCINGVMKKIDTTLHKPVVFVNGTKKTIKKACTFVNGNKVILWGQPGVLVDYIKSDGLLTRCVPFAIGENWLVCNNSKAVVRLDISNLSNPSVIQSVGWGVAKFNGYKSGSGHAYYDADATTNTSGSGNELDLNTATGEITVARSSSCTFTASGGGVLGSVNDYIVFGDSFGARVGSMYNTYGSNYYFNSTKRYSTGSQSGTWLYLANKNGIQISNTQLLVRLAGSANTGHYIATYTGISQKNSDGSTNYVFADGNTIIGTRLGSLVASNISTMATEHTYTPESDTTMRFVGRNGNYYYLIEYTANSAKLRLLNVSDLTSAWTQDLPLNPFDDEGITNFWSSMSFVAHISQTGFLAVAGTALNKTRVVRFSTLFD